MPRSRKSPAAETSGPTIIRGRGPNVLRIVVVTGENAMIAMVMARFASPANSGPIPSTIWK
jgi:hypothetical protein